MQRTLIIEGSDTTGDANSVFAGSLKTKMYFLTAPPL